MDEREEQMAGGGGGMKEKVDLYILKISSLCILIAPDVSFKSIITLNDYLHLKEWRNVFNQLFGMKNTNVFK